MEFVLYPKDVLEFDAMILTVRGLLEQADAGQMSAESRYKLREALDVLSAYKRKFWTSINAQGAL